MSFSPKKKKKKTNWCTHFCSFCLQRQDMRMKLYRWCERDNNNVTACVKTWYFPSWNGTITKCKLHENPMNLPSSSRLFMRLILTVYIFGRASFPFRHRSLSTRSSGTRTHARGVVATARKIRMTGFFSVFSPWLRISPEEMVTSLPSQHPPFYVPTSRLDIVFVRGEKAALCSRKKYFCDSKRKNLKFSYSRKAWPSSELKLDQHIYFHFEQNNTSFIKKLWYAIKIILTFC